MQLLERKPAPEISLREVARAADVSHNAPYHHFTDRRGLLKALAERSMGELLAQVRSAVEAVDPGDAAGAVRAGGIAYIGFAVEHPHAFNAVYDPTVCIPGSPTDTMAPLIDELERILASSAAAAGLESETDVLALWGLMHGLGTLCAAGHFPVQAATAAYGAGVARMLAG